MEGGEMIWIICWCLYSIRLFKASLFSRPTSQNGGEVAGVSWCQCLVWQHRRMDSKSFYLGTMRQNKLLRGLRFSLRFSFHRESNIKCLNVPYKFLHWRFSSLLNSENCLHLKETQVQFQRLAGHGQWSWQQPFGAWGLSCNLEQIRLRKHNTRCRGSEVHQHIQALSRIWTERGKRQFGKHPSHLPACDAESVCTARSQNMSWLALMLQSTKCRDPNIL